MNACTLLASQLGSMFVCSEAPRPGYTKIRTPFYFPDGDVIDLFVVESEGTWQVTDLGEALGWLGLQTASPRRTDRQLRMAQGACTALGIEIYHGQLKARARDESGLADAILRTAQAVIRVSDIRFTMRHASSENATDEIGDFLQASQIGFNRGAKFSGRSGRSWTVDFHTHTPQRSSLLSVLSTNSRSMAHRITENTVAMWHDLSMLKAIDALQFVTLFDDTSDIWSEEDFRLVDDLSFVARFSKMDDLKSLLLGAA